MPVALIIFIPDFCLLDPYPQFNIQFYSYWILTNSDSLQSLCLTPSPRALCKPLFLVSLATASSSKDFFAPVLSPIIKYIFRIYTWNSGFPIFHHSLKATDEKWSLATPSTVVWRCEVTPTRNCYLQLTTMKLEFVVEYSQELWEKVSCASSSVSFLRLIWGRWCRWREEMSKRNTHKWSTVCSHPRKRSFSCHLLI